MLAEDIISRLGLQKHPEGGYYKETYRAEYSIAADIGEIRNVCTAIYFLLEENSRTVFHRIKSDELWFFHVGEPVEIFILEQEGAKKILLGNDLNNGESLQAIIPAGKWFAAKSKTNKGFSLVSCTVSPGFDFSDFEIALRENLIMEFPSHEALVEEFTTNQL